MSWQMDARLSLAGMLPWFCYRGFVRSSTFLHTETMEFFDTTDTTIGLLIFLILMGYAIGGLASSVVIDKFGIRKATILFGGIASFGFYVVADQLYRHNKWILFFVYPLMLGPPLAICIATANRAIRDHASNSALVLTIACYGSTAGAMIIPQIFKYIKTLEGYDFAYNFYVLCGIMGTMILQGIILPEKKDREYIDQFLLPRDSIDIEPTLMLPSPEDPETTDIHAPKYNPIRSPIVTHIGTQFSLDRGVSQGSELQIPRRDAGASIGSELHISRRRSRRDPTMSAFSVASVLSNGMSVMSSAVSLAPAIVKDRAHERMSVVQGSVDGSMLLRRPSASEPEVFREEGYRELLRDTKYIMFLTSTVLYMGNEGAVQLCLSPLLESYGFDQVDIANMVFIGTWFEIGGKLALVWVISKFRPLTVYLTATTGVAIFFGLIAMSFIIPESLQFELTTGALCIGLIFAGWSTTPQLVHLNKSMGDRENFNDAQGLHIFSTLGMSCALMPLFITLMVDVGKGWGMERPYLFGYIIAIGFMTCATLVGGIVRFREGRASDESQG